MTGSQARNAVQKILCEAGIPDAGFDAVQLVQRVTGRDVFSDVPLQQNEWERLMALAQRRAGREPLQYLLGSWAFLDLELQVGPGVLIPRPETEEVCLAAVALLRDAKTPLVLDLCAGSGALALGIQSRVPAAQVVAVELDEKAFAYLQANVDGFERHHPGCNAPRVVRADTLAYQSELAACSVDLIVCNPPYVTEEEYRHLAPELYHEPKQALVPPAAGAGQKEGRDALPSHARAPHDDGLLFYRAIARGYHGALRHGGYLVFETGAAQGGAVREILAANGYNDVEVRRDMAGHERIAVARKP